MSSCGFRSHGRNVPKTPAEKIILDIMIRFTQSSTANKSVSATQNGAMYLRSTLSPSCQNSAYAIIFHPSLLEQHQYGFTQTLEISKNEV